MSVTFVTVYQMVVPIGQNIFSYVTFVPDPVRAIPFFCSCK